MVTVDSLLSGTIGALLATWVSVWLSQREGRRAGAFTLIQLVQQRASVIRHVPFGPLQSEILSFYRSSGGALSPDAAAYLDFLDWLDLFLFAADKRLIDSSVSQAWIRDLLRYDAETDGFLKKLRELTGNEATSEYLMREFSKRRPKRPARDGGRPINE